ncbi:MAG: PIN domain-containing protein [Bacteroidia bacterium]|nr:PIN domain-containing protein [Bacteroidia bacterium]
MKPRVYIDTSVIGGYFDDEFSNWSKKLIEQILSGDMIALISDITIDEVLDAPMNVQSILEQILQSKNKELITADEECRELADAYIHEGAVTERFYEDALHIAIATIHSATVLTSWNFKHIVNLIKIRQYNSVNIKKGYFLVEIRSPRDIIKEEDYE